MNRFFIYFSSLLFSSSFFLSCNTGIEGTKKIEISRHDRKILKETPEERLLADIVGLKLPEWKKGKRFLAADNKTALIFSQYGLPVDPNELDLKGKILTYQGIAENFLPDGSQAIRIIFKGPDDFIYDYPTGKSQEKAAEIISSEIPMLIDLDIIDTLDRRLKDLQLWTLTRLWYDEEGNRFEGKKYVPIRISHIEPGDISFPVKVYAVDEHGRTAMFWMSFGHVSGQSRLFPTLFSLSDPRLLHPSISDDIWELIKAGKVIEGMTKEQCRLALGNPTMADAGRDYAHAIDIWQYSDGQFLRFEDGILVNFRR